MRKMMNKKGFSLVELMIVVVIMGILIAVAIPLYGAITENANNKTCGSNIKTIKSNAAAYKTNYNNSVEDVADIESMFEDGFLPECPLSDNGDHTDDYEIGEADDSGAVKVFCQNYDATGADGDKHAPSGSETATLGTAVLDGTPATEA